MADIDLPAPLVGAAARGELVLLIGAGFSRQADSSMPGWAALLERMVEAAGSSGRVTGANRSELLDLISKGEFLSVAEELRASLPADLFRAQIEEQFDRPFDLVDAYGLLWGLEAPIVLTTNYDRFLEHAYAAIRSRSVRVLDYTQADRLQRLLQGSTLSGLDPVVVHLHGSVDDPDDVILSERDYRRLLYDEPGYRLVLSALFVTRTVLMLGFSVDDYELRSLLEMLRQSLKDGNAPDYALMPADSSSVAARRLRDDFGVEIIGYEPADDSHAELIDFLEALSAESVALRAAGMT
ncbi:MAG: SIR2 family protein [bacterium]|nr:SIR2 family protein [bacterium]